MGLELSTAVATAHLSLWILVQNRHSSSTISRQLYQEAYADLPVTLECLMAHSPPIPLRRAISAELLSFDGTSPLMMVTGAVCPGQTYRLLVSDGAV